MLRCALTWFHLAIYFSLFWLSVLCPDEDYSSVVETLASLFFKKPNWIQENIMPCRSSDIPPQTICYEITLCRYVTMSLKRMKRWGYIPGAVLV